MTPSAASPMVPVTMMLSPGFAVARRTMAPCGTAPNAVIDTDSGPVYSLPLEEVLLADCAELVRDCSVVGVPTPEGARFVRDGKALSFARPSYSHF